MSTRSRLPQRSSRQRRRWLPAAGALTASCLALSGCGLLSGGIYETSLPGGVDTGPDPITVTAHFSDVLDLVPQSNVAVDNVPIGTVTSVSLAPDGRSAVVEMVLDSDVAFPEGTTARIQQTTLLGEKFVALVRPPAGASGAGTLGDGDVVPLAVTSQAVGVEQVLGALSMLLNGGGLGQFQEISRELQQVGGGRTDEVRDFLRQTADFVGVLDDNSEAITGALDGLDALARTLEAEQPQIVSTLEDLEPGLAVLSEQREDLVALLAALERLSDVTVATLDESADDIVADLELLAPILQQLEAAGTDLPQALEILLTYPFPDSVLSAVRGDYFSAFASIALTTPGGEWEQPPSLWPFEPVVVGGATIMRFNEEAPPLMLPPTDDASPTGLPSPTEAATPTDPGSPTDPTDPTGPTAPGSPSGPGSPTSPSGPSGQPSSPGGSPTSPAPTSPGDDDSPGEPGRSPDESTSSRSGATGSEGSDG